MSACGMEASLTVDSLPSFTDPLPNKVLPLVLVGVFEISSQSAMISFSFRPLRRSDSDGFLLAAFDRGSTIGGEIWRLGYDGCDDCEEKIFLAVSHFLTPSRFVGSLPFSHPVPLVEEGEML